MRPQDELSPYFLEIEQRTDRALEGLRKVRRSAKLKALPSEPRPFLINSAFVMIFIFFVAMLID